jgi:predicted membrane protein
MKFLEMENTENDQRTIRRRAGGRVWVPLGLVIIGGALLLRQLGLGLPEWMFSWQVLLITIGIILGFSHAFRGPGWLIMILVGTFFLMDQMIPGLDFHRFIWPAVIIVVGLVMLIRPKKPHWMDHDWEGHWRMKQSRRWQQRYARRGYPGMGISQSGSPDTNAGSAGNPDAKTGPGFESRGFSSEDFIDATAVFGGIHKNILSKNFRGGDITIFMGGAEINLSQADIQGTAALDITQVMGGTKIIVPPHWEVRSQLTSVFGSIEDKRQNIGATNPDKVLIIDGSSVFGGIEIRSY